MTPQCNTVFHYTKQPLLSPGSPNATLFTSGTGGDSGSSRRTKNRSRTDRRVEDKRRIKCVIVGDKAVGKTSLAVSYSNDRFPREYVPTAYDNYNVVVQVNGKPVRVELCDTAGQDRFDPLRNLCYPGTDVFLLCFSIVKPESFDSACGRWANELKRLDVPVILVGTQADLRDNDDVISDLRSRGNRPIQPEDARGLAERLNAPYVETSALTCNRLKEAFDTAIVIALRRQDRSWKRWWRALFCCVL